MSVSAEPTSAAPGRAQRPRTAVATVCISGTLEDKLAAAAAAGFDGVEIFEPDLVASPLSAAEIRAPVRRPGPDRSTSTSPSATSTRPTRSGSAANLRRAERKFDIMEASWAPTWSWSARRSPPTPSTTTTRSPSSCTRWPTAPAERGLRDLLRGAGLGQARQHLRAVLGHRAPGRPPGAGPVRRQLPHPVPRLAIRPASADIPGEKLFFLQLADAPHMDMDVLQWSRHHRLFPGQGAFDLPAFLGHVLDRRLHRAAVARGVQRRVPPVRPAPRRRWTRCARCSRCTRPSATRPRPPPASGVAVAAAPPATPRLHGFAFAELAVDDDCEPAVARALAALGFTHTGSAPHQAGAAVAAGRGPGAAQRRRPAAPRRRAVAALGLETDDPTGGRGPGQALLAPVLPRTRGPAEADLSAVAAPDGTSVFFCRTGAERPAGWPTSPTDDGRRAGAGIGIDRRSTTSR